MLNDASTLHAETSLISVPATSTQRVGINSVSGFNASHIFVDIFMIMHRAVMKLGT